MNDQKRAGEAGCGLSVAIGGLVLLALLIAGGVWLVLR